RFGPGARAFGVVRRTTEPRCGVAFLQWSERRRNGGSAERLGTHRQTGMACGQGVAAAGTQQRCAAMTPARWLQVKELFESAVELTPSERAVFLAQACDDDELRREVEALLASDNLAPNFMETPAVAMVAETLVSASSELSEGQLVGPYHIVEAIRGGGMGEVYLARD